MFSTQWPTRLSLMKYLCLYLQSNSFQHFCVYSLLYEVKVFWLKKLTPKSSLNFIMTRFRWLIYLFYQALTGHMLMQIIHVNRTVFSYTWTKQTIAIEVWNVFAENLSFADYVDSLLPTLPPALFLNFWSWIILTMNNTIIQGPWLSRCTRIRIVLLTLSFTLLRGLVKRLLNIIDKTLNTSKETNICTRNNALKRGQETCRKVWRTIL